MRTMHTKTLLAVAALALGLAGEVAAQAPRVERPPANRQRPSSAGSVKVIQTEQPAEETPTAESTTAQTATPQNTQTAPPATATAQGGQIREEMAIAADRDWLALVDAGQFPESYDAAGELFRGSLPRDQWAAALGKSRQPLGNVVQRNMKSVVVTQDLPNAPKGKYVVTTFETSFQQQQQPLWEVITAFLNPNGQWKVVGYQVKAQENSQKPPAR
jgi:hypothetical protein